MYVGCGFNSKITHIYLQSLQLLQRLHDFIFVLIFYFYIFAYMNLIITKCKKQVLL
jgi:hypothetical protein